jgi:hypothetical protein
MVSLPANPIAALKRRICKNAFALLVLFSACARTQHDYPITAAPFTAVELHDQFWGPRIQTNREVTIPYIFNHLEESGVINNFALAGGLASGEQCGNYPFDDTDVFKTIEGASYSLAAFPDANLQSYVDSVITLVAAAQEPDGYLYTSRSNNASRFIGGMGKERWSNLGRSHELYNAGHLYEAAVAYFLATSDTSLLAVAMKNAELILETLGPQKRRTPPGHQEIEIGLVKLYRLTDDQRYLQLAKFFLEERGHSRDGRELWGEYAQDHRPIFEQREAVGHAVRAPYMYSAMADIAALTGDDRYVAALHHLWKNVTSKKLHITGGIGSVGMGESFGGNYELPNMTAYNETCSSIANMMWQYRMFLLHGDAKYLDVLERTLYNAFLAGVSLNGKEFFYDNPLASRGQHQRKPWLYCSCCISNVARFFPSLTGYFYATKEDAIFVNLYGSGTAALKVRDGIVGIRQETNYPWEGDIKLTIAPDSPRRFAIHLRVPGWARSESVAGDLYRFEDQTNEDVAVKVNGETVKAELANGFLSVQSQWQSGDVIDLHLPMPVRRVVASDSVTENIGKVALQRGPIIYCADGVDQPGGYALNLVLPDQSGLATEFRENLLGGMTVIRGQCEATSFNQNNEVIRQSQPFVAIPYFGWAHRGKSEMAVWLARGLDAAKPLFGPTIASRSSASSSGGEGFAALSDNQYPSRSNDKTRGVFLWSPGGDTVWVQYNFPQPEEISEVQVFWFDDNGDCRVPKSWRLSADFRGEWRSVWNDNQPWGIAKDRFNDVVFETVKTAAVRLEAVVQPNASAGILEWKIY